MLEKIANALGPGGTQILFMVLGLIVIYFFMLRPRRQQEQQRRSFFENLKPGTPVVTIGGLHGTVVKVQEATVVLEVAAGGTRITLDKQGLFKKAEPAKAGEGRKA